MSVSKVSDKTIEVVEKREFVVYVKGEKSLKSHLTLI